MQNNKEDITTKKRTISLCIVAILLIEGPGYPGK